MQGTIPALFEGQMESYIRCTQVDYVSSRLETFFDIQLNVKEKKNGVLSTVCVWDGLIMPKRCVVVSCNLHVYISVDSYLMDSVQALLLL